MDHGRYQRRLTFEARRTNWLERVLFAIGGLAVIAIGFFFVTVALIVGALLALAIVARLWWVSRKLRRARDRDVVEGEYEVVERSEHERRR
jgi:uncharacterized membrane protein